MLTASGALQEGTVLTMENTNGGSPCLTISPVYKRMVRLLRENIDAEQIANAVFWVSGPFSPPNCPVPEMIMCSKS